MKILSYLFLAMMLMMGFATPRASASIVTIDAMNADGNPASDLEGTLGGSGVDGTSLFSISSAPSSNEIGSTFAAYSVANVDIDDDGAFDDSFTFEISFSSPNNVNFFSSLESMGLGDNEDIDLGESLTMNVSITSNSSITHNVVFDGFDAFDFISMSEMTVDVNGTDFEILGGNTELGQLFAAPTLTFENLTANPFNSGTFEDWSLQFSTQAIPEPTSLATFSIALFIVGRRRRIFV